MRPGTGIPCRILFRSSYLILYKDRSGNISEGIKPFVSNINSIQQTGWSDVVGIKNQKTKKSQQKKR